MITPFDSDQANHELIAPLQHEPLLVNVHEAGGTRLARYPAPAADGGTTRSHTSSTRSPSRRAPAPTPSSAAPGSAPPTDTIHAASHPASPRSPRSGRHLPAGPVGAAPTPRNRSRHRNA